jgi:acetyl-CoA carboxylase biotin carboxylase subunit
VPGSAGILESFEQAQKLSLEMGYPVMLKATAGGGGKGMRAVWKEEDLLKAWEGARQESAAAFGNDGMYLEKLIEEPRHIEIQVVGDSYGKACHLSERDCSVQRRHQKLTEETPSPFMTDELRTRMGEAAVKAAEAKLGDQGRVLLRASGTEPLVRVMVEAQSDNLANEIANDLVKVVEAELG